MNNIKRAIQEVSKVPPAPSYLAVIGDPDGLILTGQDSVIYVTLFSGQVVTVHNRRVPNVAGVTVEVGYERDSTLFEVLRQTNSQPSAADYPLIPEHAENHQYPNIDTLFVSPSMFMPLLVLPLSGTPLSVRVYSGVVKRLSAAGTRTVDVQDVDLTASLPLYGARIVLLEIDDDGAAVATDGTLADDRALLTDEYIPTITRIPLCAIILEAGMDQIRRDATRNDFIELRFSTGGTGGGVQRSEWLQNGFIDTAEYTLLWDDATTTFTITPVGASFRFYKDGVMYTKTVAETIVVGQAEGYCAIYYNENGILEHFHNPTRDQIDDIIENECWVAGVYWDDTNSEGKFQDESHGYRMSPATHHYLHDTMGTQFNEGLGLIDVLADESGALNSHAQFGVATGAIYDEDLEHTMEAVATATGCEVFYFSGVDLRWTTNAGYSVLTTGTGRLAYNNAGAQTEVGNGKFVLCHVVATGIHDNDGSDGRCIAIQGQAEYNTLSLARAGAETEIRDIFLSGNWRIPETLPVATLIFQTSNAYSNAVKARIVSTTEGDYVDWRFSKLSASSAQGIPEHGTLPGLADDDHLQYLLATGLREWLEQGSNPTTPATGYWNLYFKADGLYTQQDDGTVVGPLGTGGGGGGGGGGGVDWTAEVDGALATGTGIRAMVAAGPFEIAEVYIYCKNPGSASSTIVDVNLNGTTIFTTQGNRPTLAYDDADQIAVSGTPEVTTVAAGDLLTWDIDQVATGAEDLTVVVVLTPTVTVGEDLTSQIDGATDVFTLSATPATGKVMVFYQGILQNLDAGHYTLVGTSLTLGVIPTVGQTLYVVYPVLGPDIDASVVSYTPDVYADWDYHAPPVVVSEALDELGDRVTTNEAIQVVTTSTNSVASGTAQITFDDTVPQITEGTEFLSRTITPKSATNVLDISISMNLSSVAAAYLICSIFKDAGADAIYTKLEHAHSGNEVYGITMLHSIVAGSTSEQTFTVRVGTHQNTLCTLNGINGSRYFGGALRAWIKIVERKP